MTQAAAPPPAPQQTPVPGGRRAGAPGTPAAQPGTADPSRRTTKRLLARRASQLPTPTLLRLVGVLTVVAALASGFFGWRAGQSQASALEAVSTSADRLLAAQQVRNDMVAADALATNGFLVGGLEPTDSREQYAHLIDNAAQGLARLDFPDTADTDQVAQATAALATYTGLVEQARAANRQGLPIGIAYLDQASAELRSTLLPALDDLVSSGADDAAGRFDQVADAPLLLLLVLLGLGVMVAAQVWDARRTHRAINLGLAGASVLVLVTLVAGLGLVAVDRSAHKVRTGPYRATLASSQAVSQAYDAQALESLTLIKHGSGSAYEAAFVASTNEAQRQLDRISDNEKYPDGYDQRLGDPVVLFKTWLADHHEIRQADDTGDWDEAVTLALDESPSSARSHFTAFVTAATTQAEGLHAETTDGLDSRRSIASSVSWVAVVACLGAAGLAWQGLAKRREEYR